MISLGRRWDGVERDCERWDGCRVGWTNGSAVDQGLPNGRWRLVLAFVAAKRASRADRSVWLYVRRVRSGSESELGLGGGSCRCDWRRPGGQSDALKVRSNRGRLGQGRDYFHPAPAVGALCNVDCEHARQELAPGEAARTRLSVGLARRLGLVIDARHNPDKAPVRHGRIQCDLETRASGTGSPAIGCAERGNRISSSGVDSNQLRAGRVPECHGPASPGGVFIPCRMLQPVAAPSGYGRIGSVCHDAVPVQDAMAIDERHATLLI